MAAHLILLLALLILPTSFFVTVGLLLWLGVNGLYTYHSWRNQSQITHLALAYDQLTVMKRGEWSAVDALVPVFVTSWLTILKLGVEGERHFLALWHDSGDAEQLRQLRVWLLCGGWRRLEESQLVNKKADPR